MNVKEISVSLEHRFYFYNGDLYTKLSFPYSYWEDYLLYFDQVNIIARAKMVESIDSSYKKVNGAGVTFTPMPYYIGVKEFVLSLPKLIYNAYSAVKGSKGLLLRSGNISNLIWLFAILLRVPYLREYPGNIKQGIVGFGGDKLAIRAIALVLDYMARIQARYSKANSYVSEYCKGLYPSHKPSYVFSSFNADEIKIRKKLVEDDSVKIISVGRVEGEKGHKDLIDAISTLELDLDLELIIVGDGTQRKSLEEYSKSLGVNASFLGSITDRKCLFELMSLSSIFVIPSHTEGMPRALLEAMTIGLPCIGSSVGGIPEVLDKEMLFLPSSPKLCAGLLSTLILNKELSTRQGERNYNFIQKNYSKKNLDEEKIKFWSELYS